MTGPDAARVMAAVRATWPPARAVRVGPFDVPLDPEGSRRAIAARPAAPAGAGAPGRRAVPGGLGATAADLAAVEAARPGAIFATVDGADDALCALLSAGGYRAEGASLLMAGPAAPLLGDLPRVSGFPHWPPAAICEAMWAAHGNGPASLRAAGRAPEPRAAILLRAHDRAAGALFVAVADGLGVLHMVLTLPAHRRRGVGMLGLRHAAAFAAGHGATHLALPVERGNAAAVALYRRAGLEEVGGYRYWRRP